jgi:hypothetical protein
MLEFDIPVHGDNRGWFKENFQKEKMLPLVSQKAFSLKISCKITYLFRVKMFYAVYTLSLGISTFRLRTMVVYLAHGLIYVKAKALVTSIKQKLMPAKGFSFRVVLPMVSKF